jgi:hypothetical protein
MKGQWVEDDARGFKTAGEGCLKAFQARTCLSAAAAVPCECPLLPCEQCTKGKDAREAPDRLCTK